MGDYEATVKLSAARAPSVVLQWLRGALREHPEFAVVFDAALADVDRETAHRLSATSKMISSPWGKVTIRDAADKVIGTLGRDLARRGMQAPIAAGIL